MASHSPDSVTAALSSKSASGKPASGKSDEAAAAAQPLSTTDVPASQVVGGRLVDSRVVVVPATDGISPADIMPDEKTVISAAKQSTPPEQLLLPLGAKRAVQYLGETLIGRRLEHYDLIEFVGGGGMGAVFRANDTRLGRHVAVKVLSRDQSSEENVRRFRNEAQSAARLDHRYIARVHYVGEDAGLNFIVFEFIEGINIRELVQEKGPLPIDEALRYTMQVAEALSHASQRDVVHRDIKPSNVLVTPEGHIKLVDMGLARLHQVDSSFDDLTASGVTLGTFDYISPEQARDPRVADVRSDIYSLGCTLYFMLVGKPPFPDGSAMQKLLNHSGEDPPDVRLFRPELPSAVTPLLTKMLAKRPVQRHQTAQELVADIERMGRDLGLDIGSAVGESVASVAIGHQPWAGYAFSLIAPVVALVAALLALEFATRPNVDESRLQLRPAGIAAVDIEPPRGSARDAVSTPGSAAGETELEAAENARGGTQNSTDPPGETSSDPPPLSPAGRTADAMPPVSAIVDQPLDVGPPPDSLASRGAPATAATADIVPTPSNPARAVAPRIVVRPGSAASEEGDVVSSLSLAIRRAAEKGLEEVELDFNGELAEYPFEVPAGRMLIRPAAGRRPAIVFRPELTSVSDQRQMIHLLGNSSRLDLQDVDLRLILPKESSFNWCLFAIHPGQTLQLANCVLTVADPGSQGIPLHENVSVVQLQSRRVTETMKMEDEMTMIAKANIQLSDCLVRGEANFLTVPDELPVRLDWRQGLFISSRRLVETGGAIAKHGRIMELSFERVTIAAEQGLFKMLRRPDATHQLDLEVNSDRSIFNIPPDVPLFEFAGMPSVDDIRFTFAGAGNCYLREDILFLRARPTATGEGTIDFSLANRGRFAAGERSPDLGVKWESPAPSHVQPHAQLADHYRLSATSPHPDAGFRYGELPQPVASKTDSTKSDSIRPEAIKTEVLKPDPLKVDKRKSEGPRNAVETAPAIKDAVAPDNDPQAAIPDDEPTTAPTAE